MTTARPALALLLAAALAGCDVFGSDPAPAEPLPIVLSAADEAVVGQSNAFGVNLFARVAAADDRNLMLSPLSASGALTMLLNGADGETFAQIRDVLGYGPALDLAAINASHRSVRDQLLAADPAVELALANAAFYRQSFPFKPPFLAAMRDEFDATVEGLAFDDASLGVINQWASRHTNGRVLKVLDRIESDEILFLLDALYFKGEWSTAFERSETAPGDFRLADGGTVRVPMMSERDLPARLVYGDGYAAVELPYGRRNFSMVVLTPDEGGVADLAARLAAGLWDDATTRLDAQPEWSDVAVALPRFTFSYETELNDPLRALGMVDAFSARTANLMRMSDDPRLQVGFVKQNTFVEVNEEGTEAAAVTTVSVEVTSAGPEFRADRPFVFAIRERTTNTLLFIGQVTDPSAR